MKTARQLELRGTRGWGGRRKGAGRPRRSKQVNHLRRERIQAHTPVHLTMRLKSLPLSLRSRRMFNAFKRSARKARRLGLHINQFSIMGNHLHLIAEARDNATLARGMRSFGGCLGKLVRAAVGGRGSVFDGRFHLHALRTPTEYKRALAYVLLNRSKHTGTAPAIDPYSSAPHFKDWSKLLSASEVAKLSLEIAEASASYLCAARSWLGRQGWWRAASSA